MKIQDIPPSGFAVPLDPVPPTTTATAIPAANGSGWNNTTVTVNLVAIDNAGGAGVKDIRYALTGSQGGSGVVSGSSATLQITTEGVTMISYFATDNVGNQEAPKTLTVQIDKTPPNPPTASPSPAPNANGWNNGPSVTVAFTGNGDAGAVQNGAVTCTGPTTQTAETGGAVASGTCTDAAGNTSPATSVTVKIDRTPPTVSCSINPSILWPPNHKLVPVTASVTVMDALSGPAGFSLVSVTSNEPNERRKHRDRDRDIRGFVIGTPDTSGLLRAERSEHGAARIYTLTYQGLDLAGNAATCSATVTVPHDRREHERKDNDRQEHNRRGGDEWGDHPRK
jgi:hypothetical protein